jgi:hypothetical protein
MKRPSANRASKINICPTAASFIGPAAYHRVFPSVADSVVKNV